LDNSLHLQVTAGEIQIEQPEHSSFGLRHLVLDLISCKHHKQKEIRTGLARVARVALNLQRLNG